MNQFDDSYFLSKLKELEEKKKNSLINGQQKKKFKSIYNGIDF